MSVDVETYLDRVKEIEEWCERLKRERACWELRNADVLNFLCVFSVQRGEF